ncbi:MAG: hypothetical protein ABSA18_03180 [Dehalococcoidia bacterium]
MASGTSKYLIRVWGINSKSVFAVGVGGTILYYNGSAWISMPSGTSNDLLGVWGESSNSVFAVGTNGTILKYDGKSWYPMSSGSSSILKHIWGENSNSVFAVGNNGTILRYDGVTWRPMSSGTSNNINYISGQNRSSVFAVGTSGSILRYDGVEWTSIPSSIPNELQSVWGSSGSDVFVVGSGGIILHNSKPGLIASPSISTPSPIPLGIVGLWFTANLPWIIITLIGIAAVSLIIWRLLVNGMEFDLPIILILVAALVLTLIILFVFFTKQFITYCIIAGVVFVIFSVLIASPKDPRPGEIERIVPNERLIPSTKLINGKNYTLHGTYARRNDASYDKRMLKKSGSLACVITKKAEQVYRSGKIRYGATYAVYYYPKR